jgi:HAD superfamily hydrolase (TIGR01509 family)
MNIIIPIGGKGERFQKKGYKEPKPLINILGKPMIHYILDNLRISEEDSVFIVYYNAIDPVLFNSVIKNKYPNINLIEITYQTKGASETIFEGLKTIRTLTKNKKTMLFDCDTFYTEDVISKYRNIEENAVFYNLNQEENPIYSYISFDDAKIINSISEKKKISDYANTGIYCFSDINELFDFSKEIVEKNVMFNGECYTSCIIDAMLKNKKQFVGIELNPNFVFNLGTPKQLETYINNVYFFLFDLDGTLVNSENIYYEVWKELLTEYNVSLTREMFQQFISGNSDEISVKNIFQGSHCYATASQLSQKKDALFIKHLHRVEFITGTEDFLKIIKQLGYKMAVVTNSNRGIAEMMLSYLNLSTYFDFIVVGSECNNPKPYPDPYDCAIKKFNAKNNKTFIFEDSKTGILSATCVYPKCIVGIETSYDKKELLNCGAHITIKNYNNLDIKSLKSFESSQQELSTNIINSIDLKIESIQIENVKLKGGFISDVVDVKIKIKNDVLNCVAKLENSSENFLTEMSNKLNLFNREYYFYEFISQDIPIKIPKFYGIIKNQEKKIGILLENINDENYKLNLNLNSENLVVTLNVIDSLTKLHSHFWGKNTNAFKKLKKNNDELFNPSWSEFVVSRWPTFKDKWSHMLNDKQILIGERVVKNFTNIQQKLSDKNLTFCHGDVKSANIFYKIVGNNSYEPYFIDWQYITLGKGVQDLVFFMIESFDIDKMIIYKTLFKEYYYVKLLENGVVNYSKNDYESDFESASYYFPFFVAMWFGTISEDELIDKNFPREFIKKLFNFYII